MLSPATDSLEGPPNATAAIPLPSDTAPLCWAVLLQELCGWCQVEQGTEVLSTQGAMLAVLAEGPVLCAHPEGDDVAVLLLLHGLGAWLCCHWQVGAR